MIENISGANLLFSKIPNFVVGLAIIGVIVFFQSSLRALNFDRGTIVEKDSRVGRYLSKKQDFRYLHATTVRSDKRLGLNCGKRYRFEHVRTIVTHKIRFDAGAEQPSRGVLRHYYRAFRCGKTNVLSLVYIFRPNGAPAIMVLQPGASLIGPSDLLNDVYESAEAVAAAKHAAKYGARENVSPCADKFVSDTFLSRDPHKRGMNERTRRGEWEEVWMVRVCGEDIPVKFLFQPDGKGGANFKVESPDANRLESRNSKPTPSGPLTH